MSEIGLDQAVIFARQWWFASQWWSVMTLGDAGVCMYAFGSTGKVQSEAHRQQLLEYIEHNCKPKARENDQDPEFDPDPDEDDPYELYYTQEEQLELLAEYIRQAPIEKAGEPCP